ncbi:MAG: APC family permease, partial [Acidobacteriaceae bacterium]|nr:APC family permease [Acidobacteriaceae bacterium]
WLGKVHPRWRTPYGALIATAFVMLCLSLSRSFLTALTISSASRLVAYGATAVALLRLRKKVDAPAASLRMPFAPVIVPFTLVLIIWLLGHTSAAEAVQTALLTFLGFVVFAWTSARRRRSSTGQWQ